MLRLPNLAGIVALACCFTFSPITLRAADSIRLEALLELDPFDWTSIEPQKVIDECTRALKNKTKLKEDQICRLYLLRGMELKFIGEKDAAVADLTELLKFRPNDFQGLLNRSKCYDALKQYDKARTDIETLIKHHPKSAAGYAGLAHFMEKIGDMESMKSLSEKAIALDPSEPTGYLGRSVAYLNERKYQLALNDLSQCINLRFGGPTKLAAHPYFLRACILLNIFDNPKKAFPDLQMARAIDPDDEVIKALVCDYYFKIGKYKLAFHLSEQLPKNRTDVLGRKIRCLIEHNHRKEALQLSESYILEKPNSWAGFLYRGEVFLALGKYKEALQDYDNSLNAPNQGVSGSLEVKAYLLAACPDKQFRNGNAARTLATTCCERTEYRAPRQLMLLAMACAECEDYKESVRWAKKSLEKADPDFPFLEDYRKRLALFQSGRPYRFSSDNPVVDYLFP